MVLILAGIFLLCYGSRAAAAAAFPLAFLLFMVPLPDVSAGADDLSAARGFDGYCLRTFKAVGRTVSRRGFLLYLPKVTIEVATECSGIRSSVAF